MAEQKLKRRRNRQQKIRLIIQACAAAVSNGYIRGFATGRIYEGAAKHVCVPGLNCYSCPGALGACPIGSLQATLNSRDYKMSFYVIGLLMVFGTCLGRFICGFLCPFGLVQDMLYRIPFVKKIRSLPGEKFLRYTRYLFLAVFVIVLPLFFADITGLGEPWFCKYLCPAGTLEGGIPLVLLNSGLRSATGFLYKWKLAILIAVLLASVILYRPFCRYLCPLGAIYGIFNKVSLYRYAADTEKCTGCGVCRSTCKFDIDVCKNPNSIDCIRCGECVTSCPTGAIGTVRYSPIDTLRHKPHVHAASTN